MPRIVYLQVLLGLVYCGLTCITAMWVTKKKKKSNSRNCSQNCPFWRIKRLHENTYTAVVKHVAHSRKGKTAHPPQKKQVREITLLKTISMPKDLLVLFSF